MPKIAIVAALEREVRPFIKRWRVTEKVYEGRQFQFFENGDVVLTSGGIGANAARRAAEAMISLFRPGLIYSVGFAGALDSTLRAGDVVRPAVVVNAGDGSRVRLESGDGVLVSFESIADPAQKGKLRESFQAQAVDMEAASVARAAELHSVTFQAVKVISDEVDFAFPSTEPFIDSEGRFSEARFAIFAALRPWLWPKVIRLARNSSRASRALCRELSVIAAGVQASNSVVSPRHFTE